MEELVLTLMSVWILETIVGSEESVSTQPEDLSANVTTDSFLDQIDVSAWIDESASASLRLRTTSVPCQTHWTSASPPVAAVWAPDGETHANYVPTPRPRKGRLSTNICAHRDLDISITISLTSMSAKQTWVDAKTRNVLTLTEVLPASACLDTKSRPMDSSVSTKTSVSTRTTHVEVAPAPTLLGRSPASVTRDSDLEKIHRLVLISTNVLNRRDSAHTSARISLDPTCVPAQEDSSLLMMASTARTSTNV